jgi:peptide/nickel transport system substrate-binding protein
MTTVPALAAQRLSEVDALTVESIAAPSADMFQLNYAEPRLADPRVRQALIFALDRQGICEQGLLGYCSFSLINNRLVGLEWAVPTEGVIEYNYDPERARQLLAEAGWDPNNEMRFLHRPGIESQDVAVTVAQANWAEVGVNVEIVNVDVPTLLETVADEGLREGVLGWTNAGANFSLDPAAAQAYHTCDLRYPAGSNLSWFCRPELDELWLEARGVVDQDARGDIYREIFRAINADPPEIYVFVADNIVAYDSRLKGVKPQGSAWNQYWNIGEWYWEE